MPTAIPKTKFINKTSATGMPAFNIVAIKIPDSATTEPTDKSIPAVRITKVIPMAIMPIIDDCKMMFWRLKVLKKTGDCNEKNAPTTSKPKNTINSLLLNNDLKAVMLGLQYYLFVDSIVKYFSH